MNQGDRRHGIRLYMVEEKWKCWNRFLLVNDGPDVWKVIGVDTDLFRIRLLMGYLEAQHKQILNCMEVKVAGFQNRYLRYTRVDKDKENEAERPKRKREHEKLQKDFERDLGKTKDTQLGSDRVSYWINKAFAKTRIWEMVRIDISSIKLETH